MNACDPSELSFQPLTEAYVPIIAEAEKEAFPEAWSAVELTKDLENPLANFFLMFHKDALVGYAGFWNMIYEAHVTRVTVLPPYRKQGLARHLMHHLFKEASAWGLESVRLEVREHNYRAVLLYLSLGFQPVRYRMGYYQRTGDNALEMIKDLDTPENSF